MRHGMASLTMLSLVVVHVPHASAAATAQLHGDAGIGASVAPLEITRIEPQPQAGSAAGPKVDGAAAPTISASQSQVPSAAPPTAEEVSLGAPTTPPSPSPGVPAAPPPASGSTFEPDPAGSVSSPVVAPDYGQFTPPPRPARRSSAAGTALFASGIALVAVGAFSLVIVAAPAGITKRALLAKAEDPDRYPLTSRTDGYDSRLRTYERARTADDVMEGAFWVGVTSIGVGIPLAVVGSVLRHRARRSSRVAMDASGVTLRF